MDRKRRDYPWRRNRRRLLLIIFCVLGAVMLALAVVNWRGESTFQKQIAAIHAKGEPVTPQELQQRYPEPPKEQNAAETYTRSFAAAKESSTKQDFFRRSGKVYETPAKELFAEAFRKWMEESLADNAEALALLHEAARKPAAQYPMDINKGWEAAIPNLLKVRTSAVLLQLEAILAAQDGDTDRVVEAVLAGLAVGNAMRDGPCLIMQMIRIACYGITCTGIRHTLAIADFSDDQLAQMQSALGAADDGEALTRALIGERVMTLVAFDHPAQMVPQVRQADDWFPGGAAVATGLLRMANAANGNREEYLSVMGQAIDASRKPPHEALPLLQQIAERENGDHSWFSMMSVSHIVPNCSRSEAQLARSSALVRGANTALAVERHRLANGRMPESLGNLTPAFMPAVPMDPFNGEPLRYKHGEDGYSVYSVGEDQTDNGGESGPQNGNDVVFRVTHSQ